MKQNQVVRQLLWLAWGWGRAEHLNITRCVGGVVWTDKPRGREVKSMFFFTRSVQGFWKLSILEMVSDVT